MSGDPWARWFAERRHGGDEATRTQVLQELAPVRERVLANAQLEAGDTLLDAGCGDGLIGFGALSLVGESGTVVFDDISQELLDRCRAIADGDPRCRFVNAPITALPLPDGSVDAVTVRSVLIYVPEKQQALVDVWGGSQASFSKLSFEGKTRKVRLESQKDAQGYYYVAASTKKTRRPPTRTQAYQARP